MLRLVSSSRSSAESSTPPSVDVSGRPTSDALDALRSRENEAVERWIYGNRDIVYRLLLKMVKDRNVAEELLQETLYQALRSVHRFRGDAKVSTWLCGIARNLALRHFRDQERYTTAEDETLEWIGSRDFRSNGYSKYDETPRVRAERSERYDIVHAALRKLPESYREIIQIRDLEERSTREVADALGLTRVNVRVRLHRARQRMEELLRSKLDDLPAAA
ncbi:RNA polymerase subunit sigma-70 [Longibacter salinarum]|uniref:RNA polymerase subunit sigma-70 n=1 Tax=Longibacter salinarum TaxID=1850348 RepID=A0A2A8CV74_9BACT|nr:sigma-70 family RNA polymerase sigma factor [Longibacter salinarum]PEN12659.1 RNA polymerase subunit sigma-70 [Longibacter salinarum]